MVEQTTNYVIDPQLDFETANAEVLVSILPAYNGPKIYQLILRNLT